MAHHFHSHSVEQPAQTEGRLIRWAPYYDLVSNIMTLGHARLLRRMTVDQALIQPGRQRFGCGLWYRGSDFVGENTHQKWQGLWH